MLITHRILKQYNIKNSCKIIRLNINHQVINNILPLEKNKIETNIKNDEVIKKL